MVCPLCQEPITPGELLAPTTYFIDGVEHSAHFECALRSAVGGIGHVHDHEVWCNQVGDPDGGRSYRQSAREVAAWVDQGGLDKA
jgi:hypothetical protein